MSSSEFLFVRDGEKILVPGELPLLPLRDVVVFPYMVTPLLVGRPKSVAAVEAAMDRDKLLCVAAQREPDIEDPAPQDLYDVGTVIKVLQIIRTPDEALKILVEGVARVHIAETMDMGGFLEVGVSPLIEETEMVPEVEAHSRSIKERFKEYVRLNKRLPDEVLLSVLNLEEIDRMADSISAYILGKVPLKQELLAEPNLSRRLKRINQVLGQRAGDPRDRATHRRRGPDPGPAQPEGVLPERAAPGHPQGAGLLRRRGLRDRRLHGSHRGQRLDRRSQEVARREVARLDRMSPMSPEATVVRNYLDTLLALPWKKKSRDRIDTVKVKEHLDADHYGLEKVKERILEFLAVYKLTRKMQGTILCLVGPPGVGKTSLGRSIADSMNRKFVRISLGGVRDEAEIRGHRRTYIGSKPGRVIESLRKAGTRNPVFLLDEIDKMGADFRGDPASALLEVLDPEQNSRSATTTWKWNSICPT